MKLVSIVISLYNEEENIVKLFDELNKVENILKNKVRLEYICVNDGSNDNTLKILKELKLKYQNIKIFNLYRNFGHEIAMTAGMENAIGDSVIFMDGDLQHPPHLINDMIDFWLSGDKVILTRKITKDEDKSLSYRILSKVYYFILNKLSDISIPRDFPDFRLIDRKYIEILKKIDEQDRMFRGLLNFIGFDNYKTIDFVVPKRFSGESKYNFRRSLRLAVDSIMQFSTKPLRLATYLGLIAVFISGLLVILTFLQYMFFDIEKTGYATTLLVIVFMGSIQLIVLGIIGEYIGKIHIETKKRPLYFGEVIEDE